MTLEEIELDVRACAVQLRLHLLLSSESSSVCVWEIKMRAQMPRRLEASIVSSTNRHHVHGRIPHWGLRVVARSSLVKTTSLGIRLTRYAPPRMAPSCLDEIPLWLLRILPASLMESGSLNLRGGAKSKDVKVPDFLRRCLSLY